ncbi:glycoside hydrolase family 9 protein [Butyrivibrio sp. FCS014]|uniref:glycoside hydrolase family 9 protein n=1 Tax=Butyrivibrio sp. FCS014 TaxID=1408304 RepID=UPI000466E83D|nr:glycoside hydrolase family 9 protein [Butyrivibrio sp. FCS014]
MKKRIIKKLLAFSIAGAMTVTAAGCGNTAPAEPAAEETAADEAAAEETAEETVEEPAQEEPAEEAEEDLVTGENMLSNGDFSAGVDPWLSFCQDGECSLLLTKEGELDVSINSVGTVAHGVQIYHDGFSLDEGCVYKISFDAYSNIERTGEMRFQLNGGDYHAYYQEIVEFGTEMQHYEYTFTMKETSDPAPRFCFNIGMVDSFAEDPGPHHVYFDNFELTLEDASGKVAGSGEIDMPDIAINQIGYLPDAYKSATLTGDALNQTAKLVNEDSGKAVLEAQIGAGTDDPDAGEKDALFDFSSVKDEGAYHIEAGDVVSASFRIAKDVYDDVFKASIKMLYYQRCGTELTSDLAGVFAHPVCHNDKAVLYEDSSVSLDVSGGWHDAGDYGRYSVAGAKAAADLLLAYENYPGVFGDDVGIPESGNGIPDILDEAKYELDWLFKMQREDGGVYHKVTCRNFPGEIMPEEETDQLVIMPVSTTATGDFAGVMAIAARVYEKTDKAYADKCLEAAKKAAQYLDVTPRDSKGYKNPSTVSTGEYEDVVDIDERFWAYAELFKTTGDAAYEKSMSGELALNGYSLGWQGVAGYAGYAYLTAKPTDKDTLAKVKEEAQKMGKSIVDNAATYPYGSSIIGDYPWGSNLTIANNGQYLFMMKGLIDSDDRVAADKQLNYLFGNNATGYCFVTGYGSIYPEHPHHRPSQALGVTVPGMVVGGPNNGLNDPYVQNVLKDKPSAKCYADNSQSYSTNEITIYWNSPLIYLLAAEING